jgi:hypothetical protein
MECVYKYNNESFKTIDQLVSYISDNKLEVKISELVKQLEASTPFSTTDTQSDVEAKKADIERRRLEELITLKVGDSYDVISSTGSYDGTWKVVEITDKFYRLTDGKGAKLNMGKARVEENIKRPDGVTETKYRKTNRKEINAKYDAEYLDAVKKGEMTKEQAMKALEEVGKKDSNVYAELAALEKETTRTPGAKPVTPKLTKEEVMSDFLNQINKAIVQFGNPKLLTLDETVSIDKNLKNQIVVNHDKYNDDTKLNNKINEVVLNLPEDLKNLLFGYNINVTGRNLYIELRNKDYIDTKVAEKYGLPTKNGEKLKIDLNQPTASTESKTKSKTKSLKEIGLQNISVSATAYGNKPLIINGKKDYDDSKLSMQDKRDFKDKFYFTTYPGLNNKTQIIAYIKDNNLDHRNGGYIALHLNNIAAENIDVEEIKNLLTNIQNKVKELVKKSTGGNRNQYDLDVVTNQILEVINNHIVNTPNKVETEDAKLPTPSTGNKLSNLKNNSKNVVDDGSKPSSKSDYRKYFEKTKKEKENIEEFKKWLSSVLPQISLEISDKLIDGMAFGSFVNGVIKLYQNAEKGTGYHEAFEAVWNTYLTPEQKKALIEEYKSRKNYQQLPGYIWANENYSESSENYKIKEALAEEFIDYVRDEGKTTIVENNPVRNTTFRKILNFIKKIWNSIQEAFGMTNVTTNPTTINNIFKQIVDGQFANKLAVNTTTEPQYRATIKGTSVKFTHDLMEGMTSYFFNILYNPELNNENNDATVKALFNKNKPQLFNNIYDKVAARVKNDFIIDYKRIEDEYISRGFTEEEAENEIANIPEFQYKNHVLDLFDDTVKNNFKAYLSQFGLKFKEVKEKQDDEQLDQITSKENESTDRLGIVDAIYIDPRNMTKNEVKLLVASLASYTYEGDYIKFERNDIGLPKLKDFGKKINLLINELTQIVPLKIYNKETKSLTDYSVIKQMFDKLDNKYIIDGKYKSGYEWIDRIKFRLGYTDENGNDRSISGLSEDEISLMIAFETSFTTNRNNPYKLIVGADGAIYADNTLDSINAKRIREKWENNVKGFAKNITFLDDNALFEGPMIYINKDGIISINNKSKEFIDLKNSKETDVEKLKKFGIEFSVNEDLLDSIKIREAYKKIYEFIDNNEIKTFDDLFGKQIVNSSINYLTKVESDLTGDETILSVRNAEGKQQYSSTQTSAISNIVNSFNSSKTLTDFIASNPHLGNVDLNTGEVILFPYVENSLLLQKGGKYFDNKGNKRANATIEYRYILGVSGEKESIGKSTDSLTFPDKIAQEIYHLLDGTYYTVINSDKASELGLNLYHFISYKKTTNSIIENDDILNAYKNALADEVNTAIYESTDFAKNIKIQEYSENVLKLGHFKNILKLDENKSLNAKYQKVLDKKMTVDEFINLSEVNTLIVNYLNNKIEKTKEWLIDSGIVTKFNNNQFKTNFISKEKLQQLEINIKTDDMYNSDFTNLVKFLVVNRQLGVFEQHKLIYGHPDMYKDLPKRSSGANSQTQTVVENPLYLEWMDKNMKRFDGLSERTDTFRYTSNKDPEMASIYYKEIAEEIYKDMISPFKDKNLPSSFKSEFERIIGAKFDANGTMISIDAKKETLMNAYIKMVENDGGSYIMPDFFRDLHFLSGKENREQNALLEYENALEILDRSNPEHEMYNVEGFAKSYSKEEINKAKEIKAKGKPSGVILQVLKPYGFGYNKTNVKRTHTTLLKNSVVPLTWSRVVGTENMLEKYLQAQKNKIDIIAFEGSQKVGFVLEDNGVKAQNLYDENGHINTAPNPIQEMYTRYFGFQVEMADYGKDKVIFGSQMRKINLSNLPEDLQPAAAEYNKLIDALTENEFKLLLKELGLRKEEDTYVTDDLSSMINLLRSEVEKRDLPENIVDMLETKINELGQQTLKYKFDASPIRDKLNNILNALIDNRILAQEMNGKAAVQVPATMFETTDRKFTYLKNNIWQEPISGKEVQQLPKEQKDSARIVSSDLEFYKKITKNGKETISSMEVYAPWFMPGVNPEDVGFELKNGIWMPKDAKMMESFLKSIGFRIPTQGMNSIDSILIKGFLPEEWGDTVVVPTEIVAKAGSDFDIDKLNMFFKNLIVKDGKIVEIEYDSNPENVEARYNRYINSEYADILNPLRKILSNIKSKTKENDTAIKKLKDDIDFAEELLLKGDKSAGKLIAKLFKLEINNFNDLMKADIELQSLTYEGEYLYSVLENTIDKYNDALESVKSKFTLEEFSKLPVEQQNSKKAVQNKLIDLMSKILTDPSNYKQLVSPNSTSTAKPLAAEIRKIKGLKDLEKDKTALSEWDKMASIREAYVTGKKLVGIIALQITSHSLSQYGNVELTGNYIDSEGNEKTIVVGLDHTTTEGKFILNLIKDKNYQLISELLSESMNGAVDAAKDPFIFDLNLTLDTASTWFYLQKLGVPFKDLAYLHNQPAIVEFLNTVNKNKSIVNEVNGKKQSKTTNVYIALTPYIFKAFPKYEMYNSFDGSYMSLSIFDQNEMIELLSLSEEELFNKKNGAYSKLQNYKKIIKNIINSVENKEFTQNELQNMIKPIDKLSIEQIKDQIVLLRNYLEYQKQGQMLSDFIKGISYDTTRTKSLLENKIQQNRYNKIISDGFININSLKNLMGKTFLGKIKDIKDDVSKMFENYFVSLHPKSQPFMQMVYDVIDNPDVFMTDDEKILLLNRYENFFLTYLTHVVKSKNEGKESALNSNYKRLFKGLDSLSLKLKKYQKQYPDNIALETLFGIVNSDVNSTNNIKIYNTKMSTIEINTFGEALVELYEFANSTQDVELKNFVKDLSVFSILQSGVQISPISYTKILPLDFYSDVVGTIFDTFLTSDDIMFTPETVWKQFHQNNYNNSRLVETIYKNDVTFDQTGLSLMSIKNKKDDYVVIKFIKKELKNNKAQQEELRKAKKWNDIYDTVLFERIKMYNFENEEIGKELDNEFIKYAPIGKLGNGMYLTEADAKNDAKSIIDSNNNIDETLFETLIEKHKEKMFEAYINKKAVKETEDNIVTTKPQGTINVYWGQPESETSTRILSNLAPRKFNYESIDGITREYGSVEHAYQSNKNGKFDKKTYDAYVDKGGYGVKIAPKLTEVGKRGNLQIMKDLVVESFIQNPNSEAAQKLLQYENFTHNTNELIDKAFLEGLKLAQNQLLNNQPNVTFNKLTENNEKNQKINSYLSTLSSKELEKLGGVEKIIKDYETIPFEQSEEQYIESLKCKL